MHPPFALNIDQALTTAIQALAPQDAVALATQIGPSDWFDDLPAAEQALAARARAKRRAEFATGRLLARAALARLGVNEPPALLRTANGGIDWPPGVCGSLSHSRAHVAVLLSRGAARMGLDIEAHTPFPASALVQVLTPEERGRALGEHDWRRLFCAKEAVYKALAAAHDRDAAALGYLDVEIVADDSHQFSAQPRTALARRVDGLAALFGRWTDAHGYCVAVVAD